MRRILVFTHGVLHRVLIGHAHSSKFMEWQNLGIATLKHAICATNVFLKLPENQTTTNFIYLPSSNFVTISHINYWDQVNSWKSLWKFWNCPLCRNESGPSPLLNVAVYCQSSDTETCVKKLSQIRLLLLREGILTEFNFIFKTPETLTRVKRSFTVTFS